MARGWRESLRAVWTPFWVSRLAIALVGIHAALKLDPNGRVSGYVPPGAQRPLPPQFDGWPAGGLLELLIGPFARWDAGYYLSIAQHGYIPAGGSADDPAVLERFAFFPLYPFAAKVLALFTGDSGLILIAAIVISLAACLVSFALLRRLAELDAGPDAARAAVVALAVFPTSFFLGVPYTEALFLALSLAAFYAARVDRFWLAGALGGAAALTRSTGVLLLLPLAVMYLWGPRGKRPRGQRHPLRPDALALLLVPLGLVLYCVHSYRATGDALVWMDVQGTVWGRGGAPLEGVWEGALAAWDGVRQLVEGDRFPVYFPEQRGDPIRVAAVNLTDFAFLLLAAVALVGVFRRLPLAYGLYALAALALPLSSPTRYEPLVSFPRYMLVVFPLFIWFGMAVARRDRLLPVAAASAVALGLFTAQFATLQWVA